jgi:hypothetical protein
MGEREREE